MPEATLIQNFACPKNVEDLQLLLGMVQWFRRSYHSCPKSLCHFTRSRQIIWKQKVLSMRMRSINSIKHSLHCQPSDFWFSIKFAPSIWPPIQSETIDFAKQLAPQQKLITTEEETDKKTKRNLNLVVGGEGCWPAVLSKQQCPHTHSSLLTLQLYLVAL